MQEHIGRRAFLVGAGAVAALAACSGRDRSEDDGPIGSDGPEADDDGRTDATEAEAPQARVLLLGEEYLLADALALGVVPVASTATVAEAGFAGIERDTTGIQVLDSSDRDLESLVALDTDVVVVTQRVADAVGADALAPFGELTVVPDGITSEEVLGILAGVFDRIQEADELLARLTEAKVRAQAEIPPQEVSVAVISPGPSVAVFVDGPWVVPQALLDAGCTLVPGPDQPHDEDGRVSLPLEDLDLIAGPTLLLMISEAVEGELAAVEQIEDDPRWSDLPAPAAGRAHRLDRLGYPGVEGQIRLLDDLVEIIGS